VEESAVGLTTGVAEPEGVESQGRLRGGALGLPEVLMQAVGHIGPAAGLISSMVFVTSLAGIATPITLLMGGGICLLVAIALAQLAQKIHGAGGYYTYVSRTVGPRAGFITTWLYFLYDPFVIGTLVSWGGGITYAAMKERWGWGIPWWVFAVVVLGIIFVLSWRGIRISARAMVATGLAEIVIFVALGISGLVSPGPGGVSLTPFNPGAAPNFNAVYLGIVFSVLSFTGFESVAPLAEETKNPRRLLPIAITGSMIIVMAFYLISAWGILVGWGLNDIPGFVSSPDPIFALGHRLWGAGWFLVLLALWNSTFAVALACHNSATRVFFSMGRAGSMPRALGRTHPRYHTPIVAISVQTILSLVVALVLGSWIGPENNFYFVGIVLTLGLVVVYSMGNLGVYRLYRHKYRSEFKWVPHFIIPLAGAAALVYVGYKSIEGLNVFNPQGYLDWTVTVAGGWFLIGIALLAGSRLLGRERWVLHAAEAVGMEGEPVTTGIDAPRIDHGSSGIDGPPA
jgi:amino acid transporter